jgi:uncharacterized protein YndB with AHSA1/START domain
MKKDLRFEIVYPHPPQRVWRALTDPVALADWLMPNDFQPVLGHLFEFRTDPTPGFDGIIHCEVTELDPPRRLAFTWKTSALDTIVIFTLEPAPGGTRLILEHKGFRGLRARLIGSILGRGWKSKLLGVRLPAHLARHTEEAAHAKAH